MPFVIASRAKRAPTSAILPALRASRMRIVDALYGFPTVVFVIVVMVVVVIFMFVFVVLVVFFKGSLIVAE